MQESNESSRGDRWTGEGEPGGGERGAGTSGGWESPTSASREGGIGKATVGGGEVGVTGMATPPLSVEIYESCFFPAELAEAGAMGVGEVEWVALG